MADTLIELAERCEKAMGPNYALEEDISTALGFPYRPWTSSLDDAMTLLSEGSEYDLTNLYGVARAHVDMANEYGGHHGSNECGSVPLALCAAALRARAAMESAA